MFILVQDKSIFSNFFWNAKVFPTPPRSFTCAIFRAVFDSCSSFFAPEPHRNACYVDWRNTIA